MPDVAFIRGAVVTLYGRFYEETSYGSSVLTDPSSVSCSVLRPDGVLESPAATRQSTGVYSASFTTGSKPLGRYTFQFIGIGSDQGATPMDYFEVQPEITALPACESAKTPASGGSSYCTPTEFLMHVDSTYAGQLVSDSGLQLTAAQLATDGVLEEVLRRASGVVESHCFRGRRYDACDLKKLLDAGGNAAAYLRGLVADVAVGLLRDRRVFDDTRPLPSVRRAEETLALLARGEAILPFEESADAGLPDWDRLTRSDIERTGMVTGDLRFWGNRSRDWRGSY